MKLSEIRLGIVIPVYNHMELTRDCLVYLREKTAYQPHQIIVVDDGSQDDTIIAVETEAEDWANVRLVSHEENQGFAAACNTGIREAMAAGCTHVLLLNNDIEVWFPDWLDKLLAPFEQDDQLVVGKDYVDYNSATLVDDEMVPYIGGWCMAFPVQLIEEIGLLNEKFSPAFYEDVEFCARASAAGYQLVGLGEDLGIHHLYGKTTLDGRLDVNRIHIENQPLFQEEVRRIRSQVRGDSVLPAEELQHWAFVVPGNMVFDDRYLEGEGLGGAESSLVQLTRTLATLGHDVCVFNDCPERGDFNGVHYHALQDLPAHLVDRAWDGFVVFRVPMTVSHWDMVRAQAKLFWTCDQYTTLDWREAVFPYVDQVIAISRYHKQFLCAYWGLEDDQVTDLPLGVIPGHFPERPAKVHDRLIYCSVPHRGLAHMPDIFTRVKERVEDASLVITGDYTLWGSPDPRNQEFKAMFAGVEGVEFLGNVPRARLIEEMGKAELHAYPCDYTVEIPYTEVKVPGENFCLASLECQAAGTPTISTPNGALVTTVQQGDSGYLLYGEEQPGTPEFAERFARVIVELLTTRRNALENMSRYARQRAWTRFAWPTIARKWLRLPR